MVGAAAFSPQPRDLRKVFIAISLVVGVALSTGALQRVDNLIYDLVLRMKPAPARDDVVIVAIDALSLEQLGRWPWSRSRQAELIKRLSAQGSRVVALDLLLPESDPTPAADQQLADALNAHGRVVLPVAPEVRGDARELSVALPVKNLRDAAARLGHVDAELDEDAVLRSVFLRAGIDDQIWSSLALAMLEVAGVDPKPLPGTRRGSVANSSNQWTRDYHVLMPFSAPDALRRVSYVDVLNNARVAATLRDRYVLIGPTAAGLTPTFATPVSGEERPLSGVEIDATVLTTLLNRNWITPFPPLTHAVLSVLIATLPLFAYQRLSLRWSLVPYGLTILATLLAVGVLMHTAHLWFQPAACLLGLAVSYPVWSWRRLQIAGAEQRWQAEHARATLNSIADAAVTTDLDGKVVYLNPIAERLSGWDSEAAVGHLYREIFAPDDSAAEAKMRDVLFHCQAQGDPHRRTDQVTLLNRNSERYTVQFTASPVAGTDNALDGFVIALRDITVMLTMTEQMTHQATHDHLTELPNRVLTTDRVKQALANARRGGEIVAIVFLDLDGFKRINDSLGHAVGDELLQVVAKRLVAAGRMGDTIGRWGGDEFVVVLEGIQQETVISVIARKLLDHFKEPVRVSGHELFITPSIGISVFPKDGTEAEGLMRNADMAMYRVKHQSGNSFRFYSERIHTWTSAHLELEKELRNSLRQGGFELLFQPQVALDTGRISGVEGLLRWRHPTRGILLPDQFIPIAEESGLINELGTQVFELACMQLQRWKADGIDAVPIGVNVSVRQLQRDDLVQVFAQVLHRM